MKVRRADLALVLAIALILLATLPGAHGQTVGHFQVCILCGEVGLADAVLNVLLFMPLGAALAWGRRGVARALLAGGCLSLAIEITQLALPGRYSTLGDVVWNTTGAGLGALLFAGVRGGMLWHGHSWRRMAELTGVVVITWMGTAVLFLPALPHGDYYGQWTADLGYLQHYDGRVLSASVAGMPLPAHRLNFPEAVRLALLAGQPVSVRARAGHATPALAPVFSIFTGRRQEVVMLGVDGTDLVWQTRTLATAARLRPVQTGWKHALQGIRPGDDITLRARITGPANVCLWMNDRSRCGGPDLARGWGLFLDPSWIPAPLRTMADIGWIVAYTLLALWWAPGRMAMLLAAAILAACLAAVEPVLGVSVGRAAVVGWALAAGAMLVADPASRRKNLNSSR